LNETDFLEFKKIQYRTILLFAIGIGFIILIEAIIPIPTPSRFDSRSIHRSTIIIAIFFNVMLLITVFIAIMAEIIERYLKNWSTFRKVELASAFAFFIAYFSVIEYTIRMYEMFGTDYLNIHSAILLFLGIIIPLTWIRVDNKKWKINWIEGLFSLSIEFQ